MDLILAFGIPISVFAIVWVLVEKYGIDDDDYGGLHP